MNTVVGLRLRLSSKVSIGSNAQINELRPTPANFVAPEDVKLEALLSIRAVGTIGSANAKLPMSTSTSSNAVVGARNSLNLSFR